MSTIRFNYKNATLNSTQNATYSKNYDMGYVGVKGDKTQQERAKKLISELKTKVGAAEFNKNSGIYEKLTTILSKDSNATVTDVVKTFTNLSTIFKGNTDSGSLGHRDSVRVEETLDKYIREIGSSRSRMESYLQCDTITVSSIQYALEQLANGEEYHIPTKNEKPKQKEPKENVTISSENVFRYLEQEGKTKRLNFNAQKLFKLKQ